MIFEVSPGPVQAECDEIAAHGDGFTSSLSQARAEKAGEPIRVCAVDL